MLKFARTSAAAALIAFAGAALHAAPATDFYSTLLRRGITAFDAGRSEQAVHNLRIAAFGFVDSLDLYQISQAYLALAHSQSGNESSAREALRKIIIAERQNQRFTALDLPAGVRQAVEALAARLLTPSDVALLRQPARPAPAPAAGTSQTAPQPERRAPEQPQSQPPAAPAQPPAQAEQPRVVPPPAVVTTPPAVVTTPPTVVTTPPAVVTTPPAVAEKAPATAAPEHPQERPAVTPVRETPPAVRETPPPVRETPPATRPTPPAVVKATPPVAPPAPPKLSESETARRLIDADRALNSANLAESRAIYRELLERGTLSRSLLLRVAEGLYRSRDFAPALEAFRRLGTLGRGEEPYGYYLAVALYETGEYARAKETLRATLPFIEVTPDVARYQAKIEGAR